MENKATGYISIFRSLKTHWLWQDATKLKWWLDILMSANYIDKKVLIKGTLYECKRGQTVKSTHTWAKEWRTTRNTVSAFLKLLQKDAMIEFESIPNTTRITVCNYDSYNSSLTTSSPQPKPQTKPHPHHNLSTTNNDNKVNKGNKEEIVYTDQQKSDFVRFEKFIQDEAIDVSKMKEPFTIGQFVAVTTKYKKNLVADVIRSMHNEVKLLTKYKSAYSTCNSWCKMRLKKESN